MIVKLNDEINLDDQASIKNLHDDIVDEILYIQDIFSLNLHRVDYMLTNCMLYYVILPLLCGSIVSDKPVISINTSLFMIVTFLHYIKHEAFINMLLLVLLNPQTTLSVHKLIVEYPKSLKNYHFDWKNQRKTNISSFSSYIANNFSEPFIRSILNQANIGYPEVTAIIRKFSKININDDKVFRTLYEDILSRFSNSEINIMYTFHTNVSRVTGINVGLIVNEKFAFSVTDFIENIFHSKEMTNECRQNIFSYLSSKDDTLILLVNLLIYLTHQKEINKELLAMLKISKADNIAESVFNKILYELFGMNMTTTSSNPNPDLLGISNNKTNDTLDKVLSMDEIIINKYTIIDNKYISNVKSEYVQKEIDAILIEKLLNVIIINIASTY